MRHRGAQGDRAVREKLGSLRGMSASFRVAESQCSPPMHWQIHGPSRHRPSPAPHSTAQHPRIPDVILVGLESAEPCPCRTAGGRRLGESSGHSSACCAAGGRCQVLLGPREWPSRRDRMGMVARRPCSILC